jgi:polysaccharide pyruvyl transferase WcaK-like protein
MDDAASVRDDRYLCGLVVEQVDRPDRCFTTGENLSLPQTTALISQFDYLIASRFHSLVLGFSNSVPGMALSWSHKYEEFLSLFGMSDYTQDFQEFNVDSLAKLFSEGWAQRDSLRMRIEDRSVVLREKASAMFDDVAHLIRER